MVRFLSSICQAALLIGSAACHTDPQAQTLQTALDRQLADNAQRYGIAGQVVLIAHDGKTLTEQLHPSAVWADC